MVSFPNSDLGTISFLHPVDTTRDILGNNISQELFDCTALYTCLLLMAFNHLQLPGVVIDIFDVHAFCNRCNRSANLNLKGLETNPTSN